MRTDLNISLDEEEARGGGGPDEDTRFPARTLRSHGFIAIAFGFALGLTFMILFGLLRLIGAPSKGLANFVSQINPNLWICFIYGLVGGTIISAIYNFLLFRKFNLFGTDRNMD